VKLSSKAFFVPFFADWIHCDKMGLSEARKKALTKKRIRAKTAKEPALFEGENHGVLWVPGKGFERANYMGPGTNVFARLERRDQGKTAIDEISKLHDIDYTLASGTSQNEQEQAQKAREADERMIKNGWNAYRKGQESLFNLTEGAGLIKAKTWLEDWGLLSRTKFLSPRSFKYKMGATGRDATEYEILMRTRNELVCGNGVTSDPSLCQKTMHSPDPGQ
jgi:hypothetical protein